MKKKFLALAVLASLLFGAVNAGVAATQTQVAQAASTMKNPLIGTTTPEYETVANTKNYYGEDGYATIANLQGWGSRSYRKEKVKLDGLSVSFWVENNTRDCAGIYFGQDVMGDYVTGLTITNWNNLYSGQDRLHFSNTHDYNVSSIVYQEPECKNVGFDIAHSMVSNNAPKMGFNIHFESYNDTVYEVTVGMLYSTMWNSNANYNAAEQTSTVYLPKSSVSSLLDANGDAYMFVMGFPSGSNPIPSVHIKVEDAYTRAYQANVVAPAHEKVEAYAGAVKTIATASDYEAAMQLRVEAQNAISALKAWEQAEEELCIMEADQVLAESEAVVGIIKDYVLGTVATAQNAFDAFQNESTLNAESYEQALALKANAYAEYQNRKSMLNASAVSEVESALETLEYWSKYYQALQWVIAYENSVYALHENDANIGTAIGEAEAMRNAYTGSEAQALILAMNATEKTALEERIEATSVALNTIKVDTLPKVKDAYLTRVESALEANMKRYSNIEIAFKELDVLQQNVVIENVDGELYARYETAVRELNAHLETYLTTEITAIEALIDKGFKVLSSYQAAKTRYDMLTVERVNEACPNKDTILSAYNKITNALLSDGWASFSSQGTLLAEKNDMGLYFELVSAFPNRINYDGALSVSDGIVIDIDLTRMAYYNGDMSPEGTSKGANNLCINFLDKPGAYKASEDVSGLSVIVWLFKNNASVTIVNKSDLTVASGEIKTPIDGGRLHVELALGKVTNEDGNEVDAYILTVNEAQIVLEKSVAEAQRIALPDTCYFSLGAFANYTEEPNCFTIVRINDRLFSTDLPAPGTPIVPELPSTNDSSSDNSSDGASTNDSVPSSGCAGNAGAISAMPILALAIANHAFLKKKRNKQ